MGLTRRFATLKEGRGSDARCRAAQISRHRSQLALAGAAGGPACAGDGLEAKGQAQAGPAAKRKGLGLYRSIWVSLLLTCNPALQARPPSSVSLCFM